MSACPNLKSQEWKTLSSAIGEDRAMLAFIRNNEAIPSVEKARELITDRGLLESFEKMPLLTTELVNGILKSRGLITDETTRIDGNTYYRIDKSGPNIGQRLGDFTDQYGMILDYRGDYVRPTESGMEQFNSFAGTVNFDNRTLTEISKSFLSSIGVGIQTQNDVLAKYGSNGVADFAARMVRIQEGFEDEALPEEALHFFLDMIDQSTPELMEALDKIRELPIYKSTLEQYKNNKNYQTPDGKIRFEKIKKEALAKHLAQKLKEKEMRGWLKNLWDYIVSAIKSLTFNKDPMEKLQLLFLKGRIDALQSNFNSSEIYNQLSDEYKNFYESQVSTEEQRQTVAAVFQATAPIMFEPENHKLTMRDATGTDHIMKSTTSILGSDYITELDSLDVILAITTNYSLEMGAQAGITLGDDAQVTGKKLTDYLVNLIVQNKVEEEEIQQRLGDRIKELLFQAAESKRKTLFGTAVHSIAEAAILNKPIDLDALDPIIYNIMDRKTIERLVYGTASEPGIIGIIRDLKNSGHVIMTEVAVGNGEIGGIIDIIAIDKKGVAHIYDFKTKFINPEKTAKKFNTLEDYFNYVTSLLSKGGIKDEEQTLPELVGKRRSQMEKYGQQQSIYKKLLMQSGVKVGDINIIGVPYTLNTNTNKVDDIKPFVVKNIGFNDRIANSYFPNLDPTMDANATKEVKKIEDDRVKALESISKEKLKETFANMQARLTQIYNYFSRNREGRVVYEMLNDEATKSNRVKLQRDLVTDVIENFDSFNDMLSAQKTFVEIIDSAGPILNILSKRFQELRALTPADTKAASAKLSEMKKIRDFIVGYQNMFDEMSQYLDKTENNPLVSRINEMQGIIAGIRVDYIHGITPETIKILKDVFSPQEVENMKREYNEMIKSAEERGDKQRAEQLRKELDELPSERMIAELLSGNKGDVGWFFSKFLPAISNPDIIIAGLAKRLKAVLDKVRLINKDFRDRLDVEFTKRAAVYGRGLDVKAINQSLVYTQKTISRSGEEMNQLFFLSEFDEKLYYDYDKLRYELEQVREKFSNGEATEAELREAKKNLKEFELKYLESQYTDEYYQMSSILDTTVTYKGRKQSVREIRDGIIDGMRAIQRKYHRDDIAEGAVSEADLQELQMYREQLTELQEKTNPDGSKKTGDALRIADILQRYSANSKKMYENVEMGGLFERKRERVKLAYGENSEEYKRWMANNTRLVISDRYYEEMESIMTELADLTQDPYGDRKKELYAELRTLVSPFKDKDGYIKGELIDNQRIERIKNVQREIDLLNSLTNDYTSLGYTKEEAAELKRQRFLSSITDPNHPNYGDFNPFAVDDIKKAREARLKADKNLEERIKRIDVLRKQLFAMRKTENTKYYYQELENQERLYADAAGISYEELKKDNRLYSQFRESEWFQTNHTHKVRNVFDENLGDNLQSESWEPIYIWRRNTPVEEYIEEKPASHFYKYVLRESFVDDNGKTVQLINKDNKDIQGRPKPKANTVYKAKYGADHPYLNERYKDLKTKYENNTASEKERVDYENLIYIHKELIDAQQDIEYRYRLGFGVPFMEKNLLQRTVEAKGQNLKEAARNTVNTIKRGFVRTEADLNEGVPDSTSSAARIATMDNEEVKFIPVRFASRSDADNASYDVWGAMLNYVSSINRKKELEKELAFVNAVEEVIGDKMNQPKSETKNLILSNIFKKVFKDEDIAKRINLGSNNRAEVIKSFVNSVLYNEEYFEGYDVLGVNTQKTISRLMSLSSFTLLGFAPFNWTVNALSGNVQATIEAVAGKMYGYRDFLSAKKIIYADSVVGGEYGSIMKDMMADFGKVGNRSFWGQMMEVYDPIQGEFENEYGRKTNYNSVKNILSLGAFSGKIWGEWEIQTSSWVAFMKNVRLYNGKFVDRETFLTMKLGSEFSGMTMKDYTTQRLEALKEWDGLKVNLLDAHELDVNGKLRIKAEYQDAFKIGSQEFSDIVAKLHFMQKKINGSYAEFDKAYVQKTSLGRMLFFFRRYFLQLAMNRWGTRRPDFEGMGVEQGFYLTFYQTFVKDLLKFRFNIAKNWQSYSPQEKRAIQKTLAELGIILSVFAMYTVLFGYDDDDEDRFAKLRQQSWGTQSMLFVLLKVNSETGQFLPVAGAEELNRIYSNPSLLWNQVTSYISLSKMTLMHIGNLTPFFDYDKSLYYQKDSGESWLKEEGDSKFVAEFIRTFTGYTGKTFNPVDAVKGFEFSQRLK